MRALGEGISRDPIGENGGNDFLAFINNCNSYIDPDGRAVQQTIQGGESWPEAPDVSPAKWLRWERASISGKGLTLFTDGIDLKELIGGYSDYDETGDGKRGVALEFKATVIIQFAHGVDIHSSTRTTSLWKHEVKHAQLSARNYKQEMSAINTARGWSICNKCHDIRKELVSAIYMAWETYDRYVNHAWDGSDYADYEEARKQKMAAEAARANLIKDLAEAKGYFKKLSDCLGGNDWLSPSKCPELPQLQ